jgi:hypothetical protein
MTLETGGEVDFKPRPVEGAPVAGDAKPQSLLLDGQQRMTSLGPILRDPAESNDIGSGVAAR